MEAERNDRANEVSSFHHDAKRQKLDKEKSRHLSDFHKALDMMGMGENFDSKAPSIGLPDVAKDSISRSHKAAEIEKDSKTTFDSKSEDISQEKFADEDADFPNVAGANADDQEDIIAGDEDDGKTGTSNQGSSDAVQEERLKMQLLVSNFSKDQLSRYEMYRRSTFPKAAIRKIVQQSAGCTVSPNVIIAISGIAKVFTGETMEEALNIRDRMKEGKDPVKPKHIREALRRLIAKGGLSSAIGTKRRPYYS